MTKTNELLQDDNWPEGSLEEFIWERCEADNTRVREIMKEIHKCFGVPTEIEWPLHKTEEWTGYQSYAEGWNAAIDACKQAVAKARGQ